MPPRLNLKPLEALLPLLSPGQRVLIHAGPAESGALIDLLSAHPAAAAGITFCGLFIPGLSGFDYAALHESARIETIFANPAQRASLVAGKVDLLPMHYSSYGASLAHRPVDLAILHLPPPREGVFSCGLAADVAEDVLRHAKRVVVLVNPALPFTPGGVALPVAAAEALFDAPCALPLFPAEAPDAGALAIGAHVAPLVEDGDCLQLGIGKVPGAILRQLTGRRHLRLFGGMITDDVLALVEAGALAPGQSITSGIAVGTAPLHALAGAGPVAMRGIRHTHAAAQIAQQAQFISINSAIEIDLFGAVNCESVRARPVSGVGGGTDFMRGARLAPGGRSVIALNAEAKGHSRIVPQLAAGATSIARADIDMVATEHGLARLRDLSVEARAQALIALAAPGQRAGLEAAWSTLRAGL